MTVLAGAYASDTPDGGVALYGSADSLRSLTRAIRLGTPTELRLMAPPDEIIEQAPISAIRLMAGRDTMVKLRVVGGVLEIEGGVQARAKLAQGLDNLADTTAFGGLVPPHVDLEYFPGHSFLDEGSAWMSVTLLLVADP